MLSLPTPYAIRRTHNGNGFVVLFTGYPAAAYYPQINCLVVARANTRRPSPAMKEPL